MNTETPRDGDNAKLCAWCGDPIRQSGVGRSRDYCRRSCRQRAYESRQFVKRLAANRVLWESAAADSSRDEPRNPRDSSRVETRKSGDSTRDETKVPGPAPVPPQPAGYGTPMAYVLPDPEPSPPAPRRKPSPALQPAPDGTLPLPIGLIGFGFGSSAPKQEDADDE
ncbi:hypothetical protein [Streptomyces prunicolor]|uniref:SpdA protein n=1 Tax=Streptomyces prunicolor TaxID=67348 RepID=A0ABU4FQ64_9ACTN|nr:hypothetical protein [Streptomyces prunicolor]MDV7222752.1 hypothetical protein [Streptomyces prunicolor]